MLITSWTTERLSTNGNDVKIEWNESAPHSLSVYEDDCEIAVIVLGIGVTIERANVAAKRLLQRIEATGTDRIIDNLDIMIERARQIQHDRVYAESESGDLILQRDAEQ